MPSCWIPLRPCVVSSEWNRSRYDAPATSTIGVDPLPGENWYREHSTTTSAGAVDRASSADPHNECDNSDVHWTGSGSRNRLASHWPFHGGNTGANPLG